ncbi:NAD(P)/FAD-dependent oxidoreductase [Pseudoponticoccus marisrubri]|uniref:Glycerol-3-phosphate dehydrogenase n=1 Tax=Pseudoponticoccus marisrubri TaxID=1685382 RepID=A0A0W7WL49_9RHOB|nr:FAD-dependent oxidoreductase [Pseudoponticoccus marisrubri]KUF11289.1 glycerol-3-phosphate dehydrogenase [Pseudoponticoccus marisrubri]
MARSADILIIGGGMAGASLAGRIAPEARVILLEADPRPGMQASGRSAALFVRNYGNATIRAINDLAAPFLAAPDLLDEPSFLSPRGVLHIAGPDEAERLDRGVAEAAGVEKLSPGAALDRVPILRPDSAASAWLEPGAQDIDADRMLAAFLRRARRFGAGIETNARVTAIAHDGDWQVTAGGETYSAPVLVNAAGAWADEVAALARARPRGLQPLRRSAALLPVPEDLRIDDWPMVLPVGETWYAKPDAGKLLVSPADADPVAPMDAWPDDMVLAEGLHRFEQAVTLPVTRVSHSWAGLRTFAPDKTPLVGFDAAAEGFFWLAGQGGYGIKTAPVLASIAAALLQGRAPDEPATITTALDPNRL